MKMREINIAEIDRDALIARAVEFHGHLGPYLICGVKMGLLALKLLGSRGYRGLTVTAETGVTPPVSCLVDGLQVATGCTLGKGNIATRWHRERSLTVLLVLHDLEAIPQSCHRVVLLNGGRIRHDGARERVVRAFTLAHRE
jgi:hypothetical protein